MTKQTTSYVEKLLIRLSSQTSDYDYAVIMPTYRITCYVYIISDTILN